MEEGVAATKIQASFRGGQGRKMVAQKKAEEDAAAQRIQAQFRGSKARKDTKNKFNPDLSLYRPHVAQNTSFAVVHLAPAYFERVSTFDRFLSAIEQEFGVQRAEVKKIWYSTCSNPAAFTYELTEELVGLLKEHVALVEEKEQIDIRRKAVQEMLAARELAKKEAAEERKRQRLAARQAAGADEEEEEDPDEEEELSPAEARALRKQEEAEAEEAKAEKAKVREEDKQLRRLKTVAALVERVGDLHSVKVFFL